MEKKEIQSLQNPDPSPLMSNQHVVLHQPDKFILDFKGVFPQFSPDNSMQMVVNHKVVLLEPYAAKQLLGNLAQNIKRYEEKYGKIKLPDAVLKAKKDREKKSKKKGKKKGKSKDSSRPSYMG